MWVFSRFVRYFDEAARQGSMREAGEALHVASSSVDRQILRTGDEIRVPLFERQPQGLKLTSAGELVLHGMGVGLMTQMDADKEIRDGRLVYLPLADKPIPPSVLTLCVNSERQL